MLHTTIEDSWPYFDRAVTTGNAISIDTTPKNGKIMWDRMKDMVTESVNKIVRITRKFSNSFSIDWFVYLCTGSFKLRISRMSEKQHRRRFRKPCKNGSQFNCGSRDTEFVEVLSRGRREVDQSRHVRRISVRQGEAKLSNQLELRRAWSMAFCRGHF